MERVRLILPGNRCNDLLSWDRQEIDRCIQNAIELAKKMGCRVDSEEYLREAEKKGARIDWNRHATVPTERQIQDVCSVLRKTNPMQDQAEPPAGRGKFEPVHVGNGGNLLFDWNQWCARIPKTADLQRVCRWAQGCDDIGSLFQPFMLKDMSLVLEPMYAYALMSRYCRKKVYHAQPTEPVHVKFLDRMARIVDRHRGYYQPMAGFEYINPPFRLSKRAVRTMLARIDLDVCDTVGVGSMTVSGMSAPVSVIGAAITALAELLSACVFFHTLRPEPGLLVNVCTGELDLATGRVKYFGMRSHLQNIAAAELIRRGLRTDASFLTWYRDANEPGLQACYEYGSAQAFFSALLSHVYPEVGGIACGNCFSPEQAVMDIEIIKEYCEVLFGFDADLDMSVLDDVLKAGYEPGFHLTSDYTLNHMQEHLSRTAGRRRSHPS